MILRSQKFSELTHALTSMNLLLSIVKLRLLHFTK